MMSKQTLSRGGSAARGRPRVRPLLAGLCALALLSACDPNRGLQITAELDEPNYRRGQQMRQSGQNQIALEAFLKVIDKRGGEAPESHLSAGEIYLNHIKDPTAAIYHFRRYLEYRPNSPQAPQVRQLIETAKKDFIQRELPANPFGQQADRSELLDAMEKLKAENTSLRAEIERLGRTPATPSTVAQNPPRGQGAGRPVPPPVDTTSAAQSFPADLGPVTPAVPVDAPPPQQAALSGQGGRPQQPTRPAATVAPPRNPPTAAGRTYTTVAGDTLYKVSVKVYGTGSKWPSILDANRDQLRSERDVKVGMVLKIP